MERVERAIRETFQGPLAPPVTLRTYGQHKPFRLREIDARGIVMLLGDGETYVRLSWKCLEGIPDFLLGRGWVRVGGSKRKSGEVGTLDEYLKRNCTTTLVSRWLVVVLTRAGVVDVREERPLRVRLRPEFDA